MIRILTQKRIINVPMRSVVCIGVFALLGVVKFVEMIGWAGNHVRVTVVGDAPAPKLTAPVEGTLDLKNGGYRESAPANGMQVPP